MRFPVHELELKLRLCRVLGLDGLLRPSDDIGREPWFWREQCSRSP
jgi:hypothetical protein